MFTRNSAIRKELDCEQSLSSRKFVAYAMDLASGEAASRLLVHYSNLHNFNVAFRA